VKGRPLRRDRAAGASRSAPKRVNISNGGKPPARNIREATMRRILAMTAMILAGTLSPATAQQAARADAPPAFQPEPFWPKPLPENWILGQVAGIAVGPDDHIWILHRPASLLDDEKGAQANPPQTKCCKAAPPVMEFDADGNLLRHWGGANAEQKWVQNEHGIHIAKDGTVWVGGNNDGDQLLHFTPDGKFINQVGKDDGTKGPRSNDTARLNRLRTCLPTTMQTKFTSQTVTAIAA
jgi:hypothetical protein